MEYRILKIKMYFSWKWLLKTVHVIICLLLQFHVLGVFSVCFCGIEKNEGVIFMVINY